MSEPPFCRGYWSIFDDFRSRSLSPPLRFAVTIRVFLLILEVLRVSNCYAATVEVSLMVFKVGHCRRRFAAAIGVSLLTIKIMGVNRRCAAVSALWRRVTQATIERHAFRTLS